MKKSFIIFAAIVLMAGFSSSVMAQNSVSTQVGANIVAGPSISSVATLDFGGMIKPTTAATVIMSPAGARTTTGTITVLSTATGHAASYTLTGEGTSTYTITLPTTTVTVTNGSGASMPVSAFIASAGPYALSGGTGSFTVGATLGLAASQATGAYTGTFDVRVDY
jgi:hypothetical protein